MSVKKTAFLCPTYHGGVEARPAWTVHGATLVALDSAGGDEQLYLVWVRGRLDVRQSLGPGGRAHQPQEGEHDRHNEVLLVKQEEEFKNIS